MFHPITLINPVQQMFWVDNCLVAKLGLVMLVMYCNLLCL
jgi:hypothetical protein